MDIGKILRTTLSIVFVSFYSVYAQKQKGEKEINIFHSYTIKDLSLTIYDSAYKIKPVLKSITEARFSTPEELMTSAISCNSLEWDELNRMPGKMIPTRKYRTFTEEEVNKNYLELLHKIEFDYQAIRYCFIKYYIVENDKKIMIGLAALKKSNGRWYWDAVDSGFEEFSQLIWIIKTSVLEELFSDSGSSVLNCKNYKGVDFDCLWNNYKTFKEQGLIDFNNYFDDLSKFY